MRSQMEFFPLLSSTNTVSGTVSKDYESYPKLLGLYDVTDTLPTVLMRHLLLGLYTQIQTKEQDRPSYLF